MTCGLRSSISSSPHIPPHTLSLQQALRSRRLRALFSLKGARLERKVQLNGIAILGALPDSPAAEYGLKYGDILLSVNGRAMSSVEDFLSARAEAQGKMDLVIRRDNHVMEISFDVSERSNRKLDAAEAMEAMKKLSMVSPLPDRGQLN